MFVSLGCAKNLVDSEKMLEVLADHGFSFTENPAEADVAVVNTCCFIDEAKTESISNILDVAQYKDPKKGRLKALIVAGCLSERYKESLYDELSEIDAVVGLTNVQDIASVALWVLKGNSKLMIGDIPMVRVGKPKTFISAENYMENNSDARARISLTPPYWSYLKIAEGCNNPCSFCVIPQIRGKFKSVPMDVLVAKAKRLAADGVRELNIIAQDTSNYGRDLYGKPVLHTLLEKLCAIDELKWIRVLYTYPLHVTDELIDVIANNPKICKYIDVPLQHISDGVLKAMRRGIDRAGTEKFVKKLREKIPGVCIRSSFIIGHPGEKIEDLNELIEFLHEYKLDKVGFFRYSSEDGTASAEFEEQVPEKEKEKRLKKISREFDKILKETGAELIGTELEVMIEDYDEEKDVLSARSYREAPEVDGYISVIKVKNAKYVAPGTFMKVRITRLKQYDLIAEAI